MSEKQPHEMARWPEGVLAVRVGPGANCSSMGSSIQLMWAAAVLGGVIAVVASALIGPRSPTSGPEDSKPDEERRKDDDSSAS